MTPTEHIARDLAAIGCGVASIREIAAIGPWGAADVTLTDVTLTDGRRLLADYGPAGVHAWRWPVAVPWPLAEDVWSMTSATTAGDALAISDALRAA